MEADLAQSWDALAVTASYVSSRALPALLGAEYHRDSCQSDLLPLFIIEEVWIEEARMLANASNTSTDVQELKNEWVAHREVHQDTRRLKPSEATFRRHG